jgi:hypothetical protein
VVGDRGPGWARAREAAPEPRERRHSLPRSLDIPTSYAMHVLSRPNGRNPHRSARDPGTFMASLPSMVKTKDNQNALSESITSFR